MFGGGNDLIFFYSLYFYIFYPILPYHIGLVDLDWSSADFSERYLKEKISLKMTIRFYPTHEMLLESF